MTGSLVKPAGWAGGICLDFGNCPSIFHVVTIRTVSNIRKWLKLDIFFHDQKIVAYHKHIDHARNIKRAVHQTAFGLCKYKSHICFLDEMIYILH